MRGQERSRAKRGPSRDLRDTGVLLALSMSAARTERARAEMAAAKSERDRTAALAQEAGLSVREVAEILGLTTAGAQHAIEAGRQQT